MEYAITKKNNAAKVMMTLCVIVFVVFTFSYLYDYQGDILAVGQHVLSDGRTHYNRTVGAVIITGVLWLLQAVLYFFLRLKGHGYWLTFFPSLLLLTVLTDVNSDVAEGFSPGAWLWVAPLLLVVYAFVVWAARQLQPYDDGETTTAGPVLSRCLWVNLLAMFLMLCGVGLFSNGDEVFHYRARMETAMLKGDYKKALETGKQSAATDASLTMLRAFALAKEGQMGERLFQYPLAGGSHALMPDGGDVQTLLLPVKAVRDESLRQHSRADYILCAMLLDKQLDRFASALPRYYKIDNRLPRHYREALFLYTHMRSNPVVELKDNVLEADFGDYQDILRKNSDKAVVRNLLRDSYGKTYWYYYQFG